MELRTYVAKQVATGGGRLETRDKSSLAARAEVRSELTSLVLYRTVYYIFRERRRELGSLSLLVKTLPYNAGRRTLTDSLIVRQQGILTLPGGWGAPQGISPTEPKVHIDPAVPA